MDALTYLDLIRLKLSTSDIVREVIVVRERATENQGFFRARIRLQNDDFLEVAEYFSIENDRVLTLEYRFQWMDPTVQQLRKRWDNAAHYQHLPNFPHHVHIASESTVEPGSALNLIALIDLLEQELDAR